MKLKYNSYFNVFILSHTAIYVKLKIKYIFICWGDDKTFYKIITIEVLSDELKLHIFLII